MYIYVTQQICVAVIEEAVLKETKVQLHINVLIKKKITHAYCHAILQMLKECFFFFSRTHFT